jgi:hypothetical protein
VEGRSEDRIRRGRNTLRRRRLLPLQINFKFLFPRKTTNKTQDKQITKIEKVILPN